MPLVTVLGLALVSFVSAAAEEIGWQLFPNYGSHYDPRVTSAIVACVAVIVTAAWGPRTLVRFSRERTHAAAL